LERLFGELAQYGEDFSDVRSQEMAKRALTVAGGGGHDLLLLARI